MGRKQSSSIYANHTAAFNHVNPSSQENIVWHKKSLRVHLLAYSEALKVYRLRITVYKF